MELHKGGNSKSQDHAQKGNKRQDDQSFHDACQDHKISGHDL